MASIKVVNKGINGSES